MSEEERHTAALSDPDCPPATEAQLARARRVPSVRAIRQRMSLTQEASKVRARTNVILDPCGGGGLDPDGVQREAAGAKK